MRRKNRGRSRPAGAIVSGANPIPRHARGRSRRGDGRRARRPARSRGPINNSLLETVRFPLRIGALRLDVFRGSSRRRAPMADGTAQDKSPQATGRGLVIPDFGKFDGGNMPVICPTCQIEMRRPGFAISNRRCSSGPSKQKSPRPSSRRGLYDFFDDAKMRLICPTCQARTPATSDQALIAPVGCSWRARSSDLRRCGGSGRLVLTLVGALLVGIWARSVSMRSPARRGSVSYQFLIA
jgi:hypothetical protein